MASASSPSRPKTASSPHRVTSLLASSRPQSGRRLVLTTPRRKKAEKDETHASTPGNASPLRHAKSAIGKEMQKHFESIVGASPSRKGRGRTLLLSGDSPRKLFGSPERKRGPRNDTEYARHLFCSSSTKEAPFRSIVYNPHNGLTYTGDMDGNLHIWQLEELLEVQGGKAKFPKPQRSIQAHTAAVASLCLVKDTYLFSGGWDSVVNVWDLRKGFEFVGSLNGHAGFVRAICGMNDDIVLTAGNDRTIRIWEVESMACSGMMTGHELPILTLLVVNGFLLSAGYDSVIKVWDVSKRLCLQNLTGHTQAVTCLIGCEFPGKESDFPRAADGRNSTAGFCSCSEDGSVRIWEGETLTCKRVISLDADSEENDEEKPSCSCHPWAAAVGIDGLLYLGDRDGTIKAWNIESGKRLASCHGPNTSVRCLAVFHKIPYAYSILISGGDDGILRAWKRSRLIEEENDGIRLQNERMALALAEEKRKAKESAEVERQRVRDAKARKKAEEDEIGVRANVVRSELTGSSQGAETFDDWSFFDDYLSHKCRMSEISIWSTGHIHGLQVTYVREGQRGAKPDKRSVDLGKNMPVMINQPLKPEEEILEVGYVISQRLAPGVIGQLRLVTAAVDKETGKVTTSEYKFGRITDGSEIVLKPPEGMRLLGFHGSFSERGLHQLGGIFIPALSKQRSAAESRPLTLCSGAAICLVSNDNRILTLSNDGKLCAVSRSLAATDACIFQLERVETAFEFAIRSKNQGKYWSLAADGRIISKPHGAGSMLAGDTFEVSVHSTDEGHRIALRASNARYLIVKEEGSVQAESYWVAEDELFGVIPAVTVQRHKIFDVAGTIRIGFPTLEEMKVSFQEQESARRMFQMERQVFSWLADEGISKPAHLDDHLWRAERPRMLLELAPYLARVGGKYAYEFLPRILRNLHYCHAKIRMGALHLLVRDLEMCLTSLVRMEKNQDVVELSFLDPLKSYLLLHYSHLAQEHDSFLFDVIKSAPSLDPHLQNLVKKVVEQANGLLGESEKPLEGVDVVTAVSRLRNLTHFRDTKIFLAMGKQNDAEKFIDSLQKLVSGFKESRKSAVTSFCEKHWTGSRFSEENFECLAEALCSKEHASEALLRVKFTADGNQGVEAIKVGLHAAAGSFLNMTCVCKHASVSVASVDTSRSSAVLRISVEESEDSDDDKTTETDDFKRTDSGGSVASSQQAASGKTSSPRPRTSHKHFSSSHRKSAAFAIALPTVKYADEVRELMRLNLLKGKSVGSQVVITGLEEEGRELVPARLFVGGTPQDTFAERSLLHSCVLPALRKASRRFGIDLVWLDWSFFPRLLTSCEGNIPAELAWMRDQFSWRIAEEVKGSRLRLEDETQRLLCMFVIGQIYHDQLSRDNFSLLSLRSEELKELGLSPTGKDELPSCLELQLRAASPLPPARPQEGAAGEEKLLVEGELESELTCFLRDRKSMESERFAREVPGLLREFFSLEHLPQAERARHRLHADMLEEKLLKPLRERQRCRDFSLELEGLKTSAYARVLWSSVLVKGLEAKEGEKSASEPRLQYMTERLLEGMTFEMQRPITLDDIDPHLSFLCNRGSNAVVTFRGEQAQLAALLATQKQQLRNHTISVRIKGCELAGNEYVTMVNDDFDLTLLEVVGIPPGTQEKTVLSTFSIPLKEFNVHANSSRAEGESTGWAELLYESTELALCVKENMHKAKFVRSSMHSSAPAASSTSDLDRARAGGCVIIERGDNDPVGFLKVTGLPWDVKTEEVHTFFNLVPMSQFSSLRQEKDSAVLVYKHRAISSTISSRFDRSRPWGANSKKVYLNIVDPASSSCRVFVSGLPFTLNEKVFSDAERAAKEMSNKEKDVFLAMTSSKFSPCRKLSRVYTTSVVEEDGQVLHELQGDALVVYPHEGAGRAAIQKLTNELKIDDLPAPVTLSLPSSVESYSTQLSWSREKLCGFMLDAFSSTFSVFERLVSPKLLHLQDCHAISRFEQERHEEELVSNACISGFSMDEGEREKFTNFLLSMCSLFRGEESEWLKVDGIYSRNELRHRGDGIFNSSYEVLMGALEEKKRSLFVLHGPAGSGRTTMLARVASVMRTKARELRKQIKSDAQAAQKKSRKNPNQLAPRQGLKRFEERDAASPLPGKQEHETFSLSIQHFLFLKSRTGDLEWRKKYLESSSHLFLISFYKAPWHSSKDVCLHLVREILDSVVELFELQSHSLAQQWLADKILPGPKSNSFDLLRAVLLDLYSGGFNYNFGLFVDGLTSSELESVGEILQQVQSRLRSSQVRVWCVATLKVGSDTLEDAKGAQVVRLPQLSKPEATSLIYSTILRHGRHLLRQPTGLFMRMFKSESGNPRYLKTLVLFACQQSRPGNLVTEIDSMDQKLFLFYLKQFLPWMEREFNVFGSEFRQEAPKAADFPELRAVEIILKVLLQSGDDGIVTSNLHNLLLTMGPNHVIPDIQRELILKALSPHLLVRFSNGEQRMVLHSEDFRRAVVEYYWPSCIALRGTGCQQLTEKLISFQPPVSSVFGRGLGQAPVIILDVLDPLRLDSVKRLIVRALHSELSQEGGSRYALTMERLNLLSCENKNPYLAESMISTQSEEEVMAEVVPWLARLGQEEDAEADATPREEAESLTAKRSIEMSLSVETKEGRRMEWTTALEHIERVASNCSDIWIITDRLPLVSADRILDEVKHLEQEVGDAWKAVIHGVALDVSDEAKSLLKKVVKETRGRFKHASGYVLRQQLLSGSSSSYREDEWEAQCRCSPLTAFVPITRITAKSTRRKAETGSRSSKKLLVDLQDMQDMQVSLEPPRKLVLTHRGEAQSRLSSGQVGTERGLLVTVFSRDFLQLHHRTYDTWGSVADCKELANYLLTLTTDELVTVTSFDAWERNFNHEVAHALSKCGIDGRRMLKLCEDAKLSWEKLLKKTNGAAGHDSRPDGHGHPVAAIGIPGRKPWGKTVIVRDLGRFSAPAELTVSWSEIEEARATVQEVERSEATHQKIVGSCRVITPFRWNHEPGSGSGYNTLPGHANKVAHGGGAGGGAVGGGGRKE